MNGCRCNRIIPIVLFALFGLSTGPALSAEGLVNQPVLSLAKAQKAAAAAERKCRQQGYKVSAAVVDRAGVLQVLLRGDGAGPHTVDSSSRKAYTAASLRTSTQKLAELISRKPKIQALREMNESILILGGGLPVRMGGAVVGGIGIGGAPGSQLDEACAQAGLDAIGADKAKETAGE